MVAIRYTATCGRSFQALIDSRAALLGVELVGVLADLGSQGAHRFRVGQVADQQPV